MDSSIKTLRADVDRLEKAAATEEAEDAHKRAKAQELLKAIKEKKDKEGKGMTGALATRSKENEMDTE
ncbi:hypothetical protein CFD26_104729 [Aspergillus turcosus]|uniref:Uncharacterized protein n=1 Tax=Aspergillus turcosus TaxID=1245748 RepID=A0A3R7F3R4_9EURO|nr:hypothetical protein CFD26_104729 [Aspergillus turcosus]